MCFVTHRSVYWLLSNTHLLLSDLLCVLWTALHLEMYNQKGKISDDEHYDFQTFHCCFDSNNISFYAILIALYISDTNAEYCVYFMEKVLPGTAVPTVKKVSI